MRLPLSVVLVFCLTALASPSLAQGFQMKQDHVSTRQARILSTLYPGVGQLAAGHRERGTALIVGHTAFLVAWLTANSDFGTHEEQFDIETARYLALRDGGNFADADDAWDRLKQRKDDLDRAHTIRMTFGVLSAALYTYNLVDAWLLGGVESDDGPVSVAPATIGEAPGLALVARW